MKIRDGYVTNSSSTNFIIICKHKITPEYLAKMLGFKKSSPLYRDGQELAENMMCRLEELDIQEPNNKEEFGEEIIKIAIDKTNRGWHAYIGSTASDDGFLSSFFTSDSVIIHGTGFIIDARKCLW